MSNVTLKKYNISTKCGAGLTEVICKESPIQSTDEQETHEYKNTCACSNKGYRKKNMPAFQSDSGYVDNSRSFPIEGCVVLAKAEKH